jgi:CheY-like chemotaxis protein
MKRALIVDDSRLARTVLSRLLEENGVASDAAESAEVALEYLTHSRPDVVFLDHNMPGIDGFQALDAIKKNPATATIPVMMYTSEQGEVYVGQARALGALGVLPKTVQPVEVAKVLRTLHLIPGEESPRRAHADVETHELPALRELQTGRLAAASPPLDAESLRTLLDEVLSAKAAALREDLRREIQRLAAPPAPAPPTATVARGLETRGRTVALAVGLLIAAGVLGYFYWGATSSLIEAAATNRRLAADTAKLEDARRSTLASLAAQATTPRDVVGVLEWGVNQGGRYNFGAVPLDDARATVFAQMLDQLARLDFAGTVTIEVHAGRFCMNRGPSGALELAPPEQPASTCEQIGWSEDQAVAGGRSQSLAFANEISSAAARYPRIKIENASRGSTEPAVNYPAPSPDLTAGTWNAIASANQRVAVKIVPDAAPPATDARR